MNEQESSDPQGFRSREKRRSFGITRELDMDRKCEIDLETIQCPLCYEILRPPVHQCRNGHVACATCCARLTGSGCPFCRTTPIAHSRCLALETIIETVLISCQHAPHCKEMLKHTDAKLHETELCEYRPMQCPVEKCQHKGAKAGMADHFKRHTNRNETFQLDSVSQSVKFRMAVFNQDNAYDLVIAGEDLLLVHRRTKKPHDIFFCTSFGSNSKSYRLKVEVCGGSSVFIIEAFATNNQEKGETWQNSEFLLVPNLNGKNFRQFDLELTLL